MRSPSLFVALVLAASALAGPLVEGPARADVPRPPRPPDVTLPAPRPPLDRTATDWPRPALRPAPAFRAPAPVAVKSASGVEVAVLSRRELPLVSITAAVRAGSTLDPPGKSGLASAVAGMLPDGGAGTRTALVLARAIEALGDELRIDVDPDGVRLQLTVLSHNLEPALALLADVIARPRFEPAEWPAFRARRLGEIAKERDEPRRLASELFARAVFGDHPYGAPSLGAPAAIEKLAVSDLREFHARRYGPRTTTLVLAGDVDPARAGALVDAAFAGWRSEAAPPALAGEAPAGAEARLILVDRPGASQSEVRVGHTGIARGAAEFAAAEAIAMVLGGSFTSRLVQNLREKHGYTYGIRARFRTLAAPGPFLVSSALRTDATGLGLTEIFAELRGILAPLSAAELNKARALIESELVAEFSAGSEATWTVAELALRGQPLDDLSRLPQKLAGLDIAAVQQAARRLVRPEALTILVVGDRKVVERVLAKLPFGKKIEHRDADFRPVK